MSDETGTQDPPEKPPEGDNSERLSRLEQTVNGLVEKIDTVLSGDGPKGRSRGSEESTRGDGPTSTDPASVGEQVQAELGKIRQQEEADARAKGDKAWRAGVDEAIKRIPEQTPREPVGAVRRLAQRVLGAGEFEHR